MTESTKKPTNWDEALTHLFEERIRFAALKAMGTVLVAPSLTTQANMDKFTALFTEYATAMMSFAAIKELREPRNKHLMFEKQAATLREFMNTAPKLSPGQQDITLKGIELRIANEIEPTLIPSKKSDKAQATVLMLDGIKEEMRKDLGIGTTQAIAAG